MVLRSLWVLLLFVPLAGAYTATDFTHTTADGTELDATLYVPEGEGPFPALIITNGWGETHRSTNEAYLSDRYGDQYVVLAFTSRGWGDSTGNIGLNGPNEVSDVKEFVDLLAARDDVVLDGAGDPRVGMIGVSYGGGIQHLTAREDLRIDALVPIDTWSDLQWSLMPNETLKRVWVSLLFGVGVTEGYGIHLGAELPGPEPYGPDPKLAEWYLLLTATDRPNDEMRQEIGVVRSLQPDDDLPPTLLLQGWVDTLFDVDEALRTYQIQQSRENPVRMVAWHAGHGGFGHTGNEFVDTVTDDFFAVHLQGELPTVAPYPVYRYRYAEDDFVGEMDWPPAGTQTGRLYLQEEALRSEPGDTTRALLATAAGGCTEISQFQGDSEGYCERRSNTLSALWATAPMELDTEVTGTPRMHVQVRADEPRMDTTLFAYLVDVAPDGTETPILRQTMPIRPAELEGLHTFDFDMRTVTHTLAKGHALGLVLATSDAAYASSREPGQIFIVGTKDAPSYVDVPFVPKDAHGDMEPPFLVIDCNDCNGSFEVVAEDALAIASVNATVDGAPLAPSHTEATPQRWAVTYADLEGKTVHVQATDMAGNTRNATIDFAVPNEPVVSVCPPEGCDEPEPNESPLGLWVLVGALGFAVLRRRVS